ncbi:hypothetical protein HDV03_003592 [Kappamyces sp. JEL0829]|nr:hypothetical protein HDV03_003592 [Kappamyces sp. JEL0829]KAJ3371205.1 hypothetical protein HDU91_005539 [Kappamyces sp. JEL0680]
MESLKNQFYVGNFQSVINEATNPSFLAALSVEERLSAKALLFRAYLTHGRYNLVIQDIKPTDPDVLIATQLLAMYLASPSNQKEVANQCKAIAAQVGPAVEPELAVALGTVFTLHGLYEDALRLLAHCPNDLECVGLTVQILCSINRTDLALAQVEQLKHWAGEAILAQMIDSWVGIARSDPEKYEESFYLFDELAAAHAAGPKLLCSKAVCLIQGRRYQEAETLLLEALNKNPNDAEVLANLFVVSTAMQKPDNVADSYYA